MFYISSKSQDGLLGITDSSDNVEEFYSVDEIAKLIKSNKLDIWGFVNSSSAFQDSFVVDININKFLNIIRNCNILYKEIGTGKLLTPTLSFVASHKKEDITKDGVDVFNEYLKAFNSKMFF